MRKILALAAAAALVAATTASAITFGEPDGNRHPNVGALVADWNEESPGPDQFCTGTLVRLDAVPDRGSLHDRLGARRGDLGHVQPDLRRGVGVAERARPRLELRDPRELRAAGRRGRRLRHRDRDARDAAVGNARAAPDARSAEHLQPAAAPRAHVHARRLRAHADVEEDGAARVRRSGGAAGRSAVVSFARAPRG